MSQYHNLSKDLQKRHFPNEHGNGKGDLPRKQTEEVRQNYSKGYDKITWNLKTKYS